MQVSHAILRRLDQIEALIQAINLKEVKMALDLSKLAADVAAVKGVIDGLKAQLAAIPPSSDAETQKAIDALVAQLDAVLAPAAPTA